MIGFSTTGTTGTGATGTYRVTVLPDPSNDYTNGFDIPGQYTGTGGGSLSTARLDAGQPLLARIETATDTDWIRFVVGSGEQYKVSLNPLATGTSTPVLSLTLRSRGGTVLGQGTDANLGKRELLITEAGEYWLEVKAPTGTVGNYRLEAETVTTAASSVLSVTDTTAPSKTIDQMLAVTVAVDPNLRISLFNAVSGSGMASSPLDQVMPLLNPQPQFGGLWLG